MALSEIKQQMTQQLEDAAQEVKRYILIFQMIKIAIDHNYN